MKKWGKITVILLSIGLLQACQSKKTETAKSTDKESSSTEVVSSSSSTKATSTSASSTVSTSGSANTSSTTNSQAAATSSSATASSTASTAGNSQQQGTTNFFATLKEKFPHDSLPTSAIVANPTGYTAATTPTADQNNFRILYYQDSQQTPINDPKVNHMTPVASFVKRTFDTETLAYDYAAGAKADGVEVNLGYGIKGYQQGAAGSTYTGWQEGNWNILVRSSNVQGEDGLAVSKAAVATLEEVALPAPNRTGKITLEAHDGDYQTNTVVWQKGLVVYIVTNQNAQQALRMAASIK